MKKSAVTVLCLQVLLLASYFSTLLALINPPNCIFFPVWFLVGAAGFVQSVLMMVKRKLLPLSAVILLLSLIITALGGIMRLFLYM